MPHIPEEELHAYLDQALSRLQCVDIERHLASCPACQALRDRIAALRDRTTALLATLAPPISLPPSFDLVRQRALGRQSRRHRLIQGAVWAASVLAALGLGWTAHVWQDHEERAAGPGNQAAVSVHEAAAAQSSSVSDSARSSSPSTAQAPAPVPDALTVANQPERPARETDQAPEPRPARSEVASRPDSTPRVLTPVVHRLTPETTASRDSSRFSQSNSSVLANEPELAELATESMWRLVSVAAAEEESGAPLPQVAGLPVVQVKVQGIRPNEKIVAVDQQLATGEVIRTMEGPADQMTDLLARDGRSHATSAAASRALDALMTMRFGDRIVAIRGPADSLRALMNRLPVPKQKQ